MEICGFREPHLAEAGVLTQLPDARPEGGLPLLGLLGTSSHVATGR